MRRLLIVGLCTAFNVVAAQEPQRPASAPPLTFRFPKSQTTTLPNGLRVVTVEDHSVQVVAVRAVLSVDETADPPGKEGLYQVMLNSLREGTTTRNAAQLAEASARAGTPVSPTSFTTTPAGFDASLKLMSEMLMHPSFDQAGMDRRKAAQAAVFRGLAARANLVPRNVVYSLLNGRQDPVARSYLGTEAGANALTRDDVVGFYNRYVGPKSTTVIVVGDILPATALTEVRRVFGEWQGTAGAEQAGAPSIPSPAVSKIYIADTGPGSNATIAMGLTGPVRTDADGYATEMLGTILTNRMLATLREKRAWSYSGNMVMNWRRAPRRGELIGTTTIATAKADSALAEWMVVLRGLRAAPPSSDDVEAARRARVGSLWTRIDGPDDIATRVAESVREGLPADYLEKYAAGMNAVTAADVERAAAKYLDLEHLIVVVGGDRKAIEPAIRAANIAPVEIVQKP